ncbi:MAG: phosphoribosyltransferase family protein [Patescibacteria group bacterium]|nr:phosphoribosyltransferase family protein [Patescibacteria group bacterium]
MRFKKISWRQFYRDSLILGERIIESKISLDRIIAISRGGLVAARILSDFLDLPISNISISSYTDLKQLKEPKIIEISNFNWQRQMLLVVDEISDTGKTFQRAVDYLQKKNPKKIFTACPYVKPKTKHVPDFFVKKIDAWVVFPYDLRETYQALMKDFNNNQFKVKKKLQQIGFRFWEIEKIRS